MTIEKEIFINGKKIFYRINGNGKPVFLVHGFGETGDIWRQQVAALENHFRLLVPDLPGSGKSDLIDDMSMEGMAEVIHAIIHEENINRCTVIGHSMGGYITMALAAFYPNHLHAIGLFHSSAYGDSEEKKATRKKGIEFIQKYGAAEFLKTTTPNLFSQKTQDQRPELIDQQLAATDNFSIASLVYYYESMINRPDRTDILKNIGLPVLFIAGEHDVAIPLQDMLKQSHIPEKSYIHILSLSGHMGMLEETEKSNQIMKTFLSQAGTM